MKIPTEQEVIESHADILRQYGGMEGYNNHNMSVLYSVIYYKTIIEAVASVFYGLVKDHIWNDGNKRTACVTALSMLIENNCKLNCTQNELKLLAENTADNKLSKDAVLKFFYKRVEYIEPYYIYAIIRENGIDISDSKEEIKKIKDNLLKDGIEYKIYRVEEKEWLKNKKPEDGNWWKKNGNRLQRLVVK